MDVGQKRRDQPPRPPYWSLSVGDLLPEDPFTNYDALGKLIDRYNNDVASRDGNLAVDPRVIAIRDLLAHGRVAASSLDLNDLKIIKFDRPQNGKVLVTASVLMDDSWFDSAIKLAHDQILRVYDAYERFAV